MIKNQAISLFIRAAAVTLAMAALVGRDSSAKVPLQAPPRVTVPNLMAYWKVDTDTGTTANDSAGTNNGTYLPIAAPATASTTVLPSVPAGNTKSFNFVDSSNQFIEVPDSPSVSVTGSFTLAAWVRRNEDDGTHQKGIIEKFDTGNGYSLRLSAAEHFSFSVRNGTTQKEISTTGSAVPFRGADLNTWNHVAGVYNQTTSPNMLIYKNGTRDATTSLNTSQEPVAPPTDGTANLQIGKDYGANAFSGNIDEVRIYNRALNDDEVNLLNTMVQPAATGLNATDGNSQNLLSWIAASNAGLVNVVYAVRRGTSPGVYDTVFNTNSSSTSFTDTTPVPGILYYYSVVAVSVIESANSNEDSATATNVPPPPPPPPPAPRTQQVGNEDNPCGCGTASPSVGGIALLGAVLLLAAALIRRG